MDPRRTTIVGGVALAVIAALATANVLLWQSVGSQSPPQPTPGRDTGESIAAPATDGTAFASASPWRGEPARIDIRPFGLLQPVDAREEQDTAAPGTLAGTEAAVPLPRPSGSTDDEILSIIDDELPAATALEREVWLEELRDVGPETMRRILRLWQQQHPAADHIVPHELPPDAPPGPDNDRHDSVDVFALDAEMDREQLIAHLGLSLEAIGHARDVMLNNVANAGTVGFKRSSVLFRESGHGGAQAVCCEDGLGRRMMAAFRDTAGEGAEVGEVCLDMSPGRLVRTGRALDVAISGTGFLQVRRGDELFLTRAGRLSRGSDGQIVVNATFGACALEPRVVVPDEAVDVEIARDGVVMVRLAGQDSPFEAGRILLARCADPTALVPLGGSVFAASAASGPPQPGTPGCDGLGRLRQGLLEQSNVDLDDEAAAFRALQARIEILSQIVSSAIPFASARPVNLVAAPPDEGDGGDGGPELGRAPGLIDEYLGARQAERDVNPEAR